MPRPSKKKRAQQRRVVAILAVVLGGMVIVAIAARFAPALRTQLTGTVAQCADARDNDADGETDFPDDPGCDSLDDHYEHTDRFPECDNDVDDDYDGRKDFRVDGSGDSFCTSPVDVSEGLGNLGFVKSNQCANEKDDDGDGKIDFSYTDFINLVSSHDPGCTDYEDDAEEEIEEGTQKAQGEAFGVFSCTDAALENAQSKIDKAVARIPCAGIRKTFRNDPALACKILAQTMEGAFPVRCTATIECPWQCIL